MTQADTSGWGREHLGMGNERSTRHRGLLAIVAACAAVLLGASLTACSSSGSGKQDASPVAEKARLTMKPSNGTKLVNPKAPVKVSAANGALSKVALKSSSGAQVEGKTDAQNHTWTATEPLGYDRTYTWSGEAISSDKQRTPIKGSFKTVDPDHKVSGKLNVGDGKSYGVAMPIKIDFGQPIKDKAAVQKALDVQTNPKTEGSWAWLDNQSVHWRPKEYWKPGTKVKVDAKLYGLNMGGGDYGASDVDSSFKIGKKQIIKANTQNHRLRAYRDGKQVFDFPASYGLDAVNWRNTRSGTHVVMSKHSTYKMNNERGGYRDLPVHWAVRISNNGEFIHALPESTWAQGSRNVSHGCVNLNIPRAKQFYDMAQTGDPVEVTGSSVQLSAADGDYYDWALSWKQWQKKSEL